MHLVMSHRMIRSTKLQMCSRKSQTGLQIKKILVPKIVNIFLSISLNISFGCSKEPSHRDRVPTTYVLVEK